MNTRSEIINAKATIAAMTMFGVVVCANLTLGQAERTPVPQKPAADYIGDLGDPNPRVREKAADMLGIIGLRIKDATILLPAVTRLVPLMSDDDSEVRDETAEALGVIASRAKDEAAVKAAIAALIEGLSDKTGEVREESAEALARIASVVKDKSLMEPAVEPLIKALGDGFATQEFAEQALKRLGKTPSKPVRATRQTKLDTRRDRYLLLDSRIIDGIDNAELTIGVVEKDRNNPLFKEDKPWEPRFDNPYSSVIYDEEEKTYKCWYSIFTKSGPRGDFPGEGLASDKRAWVNWREGARGFGLCYATSKDGIHWEKPELGLIDFGGSKQNNIVIEYTHGVAVMKDLHETINDLMAGL